ncbi:pteridine reductase [Legionella drozanskii]|uniref:pteridine reductase n=1 Tax=Legionella drozanskii TaxID=96228 RepID=UPI0010415CCE|nr:pteridine reductase [Legionella drozanskii]
MNQANKQAIRVALVTGASRRIGAAIAKQLHQAGFKVLIHCHHSSPEAKNLAELLNQQRPDSAVVLQQDLCAHEAAQRLIVETIAWAGQLDLLVNNASIFTRTPLTHFEENDWDALFTTNVKAPFLLSLAAQPYLAKQQGAIINLTDIHAERPLKDYTVYCQTKAALVMQTKALAREFAPQVRVNAIAPGAIAWPEQANALSLELQNEIIAKTPLKRHGDPAFIAQAVLALVENPFITGQILNVDGGRRI